MDRNLPTYQLTNTELLLEVLDEAIAPQQCRRLLLWLYGAPTGRHLIEVHTHYWTHEGDGALKRSTLTSRFLTVSPLCAVRLFSKEHFGDVEQHILGVEVENTLRGSRLRARGRAAEIRSIQLAHLSEEEKQHVVVPEVASEAGADVGAGDCDNVVHMEHIGCHSERWSIAPLLADNATPPLQAMSTLTTLLKLAPTPPSDEAQGMSAVRLAEEHEEEQAVSWSLHGVCQNLLRLKQKEHELRQRHMARVFRHRHEKHANELEVMVSFRIGQRRRGVLFLGEPFVFARHESTSNCPLRVALKYPKQLAVCALL